MIFHRDVGLSPTIVVKPKFYKKLKKLKKQFKKADSIELKQKLYVSATAGYFNNLTELNREQVAYMLPYLAKQRQKINRAI